jgi:transcriptional regulator with XRE-family HTH domain
LIASALKAAISNHVLSLTTGYDLLRETSRAVRERRQALGLRQLDLSRLSGVSIATLRRFESTGQIGFAGLAQLLVSCGMADAFLAGIKQPAPAATPISIQDFLANAPKPKRRVRLREPSQTSDGS